MEALQHMTYLYCSNQASKPPFRCGMTSYENRSSSLKEGCPVYPLHVFFEQLCPQRISTTPGVVWSLTRHAQLYVFYLDIIEGHCVRNFWVTNIHVAGNEEDNDSLNIAIIVSFVK